MNKNDEVSLSKVSNSRGKPPRTWAIFSVILRNRISACDTKIDVSNLRKLCYSYVPVEHISTKKLFWKLKLLREIIWHQ